MKPEIKSAAIGGIAGTAVMTLMMMFMAPMMTGQSMDIAAMISGMMGVSYVVGFIIHVMMGVILFPAIYVYVLYERLPGSNVVKGVILGLILWIMAAAVVMPMAGAGFFMSNIGGMMAVMAALLGHVVYGALLGGLAGGGESTAASS